MTPADASEAARRVVDLSGQIARTVDYGREIEAVAG
jgi:hypothetical protein